jgi:hypothetical protein
MVAAIVAALIGAVAVDAGFLAQWQVLRQSEAVEKRALAQGLKNGVPELPFAT